MREAGTQVQHGGHWWLAGLDGQATSLRFSQWLIELAEDEILPVAERVRLLADFAANMDRFFMEDDAGEVQHLVAGRPAVSAPMRSGVPRRPSYELARQLMHRHAACYRESVLPALSARGIEITGWDALAGPERLRLHRLFATLVYPMLTPMAVDPAHPFPYISNLSLNLAVSVADPGGRGENFARVKIPQLTGRFLEVQPGRFVPLEDVVIAHLQQLFAGMNVLEHHVFRVTRRQDPDRGVYQAAASLAKLAGPGLAYRRSGPVVRLETEESISDGMLRLLMEGLGIGERAVCRLGGPIDLTGLRVIAEAGRPKVCPLLPAGLGAPRCGSRSV